MKELLSDELKRIQLDILRNVHKFCLEHNINYSLAYGTLLGAVRHKGFIPWDDDIDIMMLRNDYDRFIKEYPESDEYGLCCFEKDTNYPYSFAKVQDKKTSLIEFCEYPYAIMKISEEKVCIVTSTKKNQEE